MLTSVDVAQVDREALVAQLAIPFPAVATLLFDSNRQLPAMVRPALVTSFIHPVSLAVSHLHSHCLPSLSLARTLTVTLNKGLAPLCSSDFLPHTLNVLDTYLTLVNVTPTILGLLMKCL